MTELPFESKSLFQILIGELTKLFQPLRNVVEEPESLDRLLFEIGASASTAGGDALVNALSAVVDLESKLEALTAEESPSFESIAAVLEASDRAFQAVQSLDSAGGPAAGLEGFSRDLINLLIVAYLNSRHPLVRAIAVLLTLIEPAEEQQLSLPVLEGDSVKRLPYTLDRFRFERISPLLRDPVETLKSQYIQNDLLTAEDANASADRLFPRIVRVLRLLGLTCRYGIDPTDESLLGDPERLLAHALIIYAQDELLGAESEAGVVLMLSSADRGDLGLVVSPFGELTFEGHVGDWKTNLAVTAEVQTVAYGRHGVTLLASPSTIEVSARFSATLAELEEGPQYIFGSPAGTRIEIGGAEFKAETVLSEASQALAVGASVSSSKIVIAPGDADSFLASFLPPEGVEAKFDLGLEWSNTRGLTFSGAAGLDATIPVGLSLGNVLTVPSIHLGLQAKDGEIAGEVSVSLSLSIGPVTAVADRIGIKTIVTFPEDGGNLGVADFAFDFKPPSGVGIKIDAPAISGGGFLFFDFDKGEYAGVLQLTIQDQITVTAIGMITTRLPNGAKGFSFVVIITAQGFQPIQLGLGFTLTGIGGLLAINRTCNEEFLREGIKSNALDSLLFPSDPIRNAPQILGLLNSAFPPQPGSFLFGPVVQICWGTPALLTMNLAVILELGKRTRLIILGVVKAIMPTEKHDLIRLQMNALGVIDFDQGSVSLDAVLFDSRLLGKFPLTGGMAMRLNWGAAPVFALSVGGFHPAFKPPPNFPTLERLAITFSNSSDFKLRLECYYAITANSVQWGAKMELFAKAGGFSIEGRLGYDVLIQISPFFFVAGFYASVQLKYHSRNLFKVSVEGELSGPRPLRIKGKATFEIFWCDFSVSFDKTLVSGQKPESLDPLDVMALLLAAFNDARNWSGDLPQRERRLVTLREEVVAGQISFHPLGTLSVKQTVAPLDLEIARFGSSTPSGERLFSISSFSLNGSAVPFNPVKEFFSPAQFLDLSDDEKLVAPSFEAMKAGATVTTESYLFTTNDEDILEDEAILYETVIVDDEFVAPLAPLEPLQPTTPVPEPPLFTLTAESMTRSLSFGAAGQSALRNTGAARYRPAAAKNATARKGWTIASTGDASPQEAPGLAAGEMVSYSQSFEALQKAKQENPQGAKALMLVRLAMS